jgi:chemotaxis protein histidine kinase CheA
VTGTVVIRVPNADFETTMEGVKGIAREIDRETVDATDVTEQYVDLEARLKNMRAEESQYQEIMAQAVKIDDILNVAGRLADVRGRIEQVQGQLQYLSRQVDMSSITVNLTAYSDVKVFGLKWRPLVELKQALRGFFESLTNFVNMLIKLIFALPVIILYVVTFGLIGWGLWKMGKWAYRKLMR